MALLPELLKDSRASSTVKSYQSGFVRWKNWALSNGLGSKDVLPAKAFHAALYLASVIQTAESASPVIKAFYSIKWFHDMFDLVSPTTSSLVLNILESAKRRLARPVRKKEPITTELLTTMFQSLYVAGNAKNQRTICACLTAYAGFLRSNELLSIRRCDVVIEPTHMSIFIESSKTDKYREGAWVVIARAGGILCPVINLERYLQWAKIKDDSSVFIFSTLSACKDGYKVRKQCKALTCSSLRELFVEAFKPHVSDVTKYCLHSLRAGGASSAANNGVPDRLFKRHGRWLSEGAKDGYVKDDLLERLKVSQSLDL